MQLGRLHSRGRGSGRFFETAKQPEHPETRRPYGWRVSQTSQGNYKQHHLFIDSAEGDTDDAIL